ncbi:hypothetical protein B0H19DRAFT_1366849 [Mycena capillaripes]|nr:hypothetical protein B0H19DRAFT_1366849 [Mycena capillaripes]
MPHARGRANDLGFLRTFIVPQKPTVRKRAELEADRVRVAHLGAQISKLERSLWVLQHAKALVQKRLDDYTYPVLTLPPEIVSEIFIHLLPTYPRLLPKKCLLPVVKLDQICRQWRQIAFWTPALWRGMSVSLPEARSRRSIGMFGLYGSLTGIPTIMEGEVHALNLLLQRSGILPLSLALVTGFVARDEMAPFIQTVSAHSTSWEHLKLFTSLNHISSIDGPLLSLRSLAMGLYDEYDRGGVGLSRTSFNSAPLLRRVMLQRYSAIYDSVLPWSQLTVLIVDEILAEDCGFVLNHTKSLVYFRLTLSGVPPSAPIASLMRLKTLVLRALVPAHPVNPVPGFVDALTLPALRRLQVSEILLCPNPHSTLRALISRSACTLQKMHILAPRPSVDPCGRYRQAWPTVLFSHGKQLLLKDIFWRSDSIAEDGDDAEDYWDDDFGL